MIADVCQMIEWVDYWIAWLLTRRVMGSILVFTD